MADTYSLTFTGSELNALLTQSDTLFNDSLDSTPVSSEQSIIVRESGTLKEVPSSDILSGIPFKPTNKYSPIKFHEYNGYANNDPTDTIPAKHDASGGAVPSFTTAKRGNICVVNVAGTLGTASVAKGDLLQALVDNPTTATEWAIIGDSTAEFESLIESANGSEILLRGTYKLKGVDSSRKLINISPDSRATIFNECGYPAIYTSDNNGFSATSTTTISATTTAVGDSISFTIASYADYDFKVGELAYCRSTSSRIIGMKITSYSGGTLQGTVLWIVGTGSSSSWTISSGGAAGAIQCKCSSLGIGIDNDPYTGDTMGRAVYAQMSTAGHEDYYSIGDMVQIVTNVAHVADSGVYFTNVGTVTSIDTTNHRVYIEREPEYFRQMANASSIYLIKLPDTMQVNIPNVNSIEFVGAPTVIGESVAWWKDLFGDTDESATISWVTGGYRRLTFTNAPNYITNQGIHMTGLSGTESSSLRRVTGYDNTAKTVDIEITDDAIAVTSGVTNSITIGTGSKAFTVGTSKTFTVGDSVEIISVASAANAMFGEITGFSGGTLTVDVTNVLGSGTYADWKVYMVIGDNGAGATIPVSGTVDFRAAYWSSEFDNTTHGGALCIQQSHGSNINCTVSRLWSAGVRARFSHYVKGEVKVGLKNTHRGTGFSGKSWLLNYIWENYCSSLTRVKVYGEMTRHDIAGGSGGSTSTWEPNMWLSRSGMSCEGDHEIISQRSLGPMSDSHAHEPGTTRRSRVRFPTAIALAHSYRYIGAQCRSENEKRYHYQEGGQIGLRIANGSSYLREPGSVDIIHLETVNMPTRGDAHALLLNTSGVASATSGQIGNGTYAFIMQDQSAYTGGTAGSRTLSKGEMKLHNSGIGFRFEKYTNGDFTKYSHAMIEYAAGWVCESAKVNINHIDIDYTLPYTALETTSTTSYTLATGSATFTVSTGLSIRAGQSVLLQDNTGDDANVRRANYGCGRVVSYTSGTGALVLYFDDIHGSKSSGTAWRITIGAKLPRFGFVMQSTGMLKFNTMNITLGNGANPDEVFFNFDTSGTKTIRGGVLNISDPFNYGMPNIIRDGADSYFDIDIGTVIYNGQVIDNWMDYTTTNPVTPQNGVKVFSRSRNGLHRPAFIDPDGYTVEFMSHIMKPFSAAKANGGVSTGITLIGTSAATASGTATNAAYTLDSKINSFRRVTYVGTAATGNVVGYKITAKYGIGDGVSYGGFRSISRFSIDAVASSHAVFIGHDSTSTIYTDAEPSSRTNIIGVGADSTDSNLQFMVNDSTGTATKVDLGSNFPAKTNGAMYELIIYSPVDSTSVYYSLERLDSAHFTTGFATSDIPSGTTGLTLGVWQSTRTDATTAPIIGMSSLFVEALDQ